GDVGSVPLGYLLGWLLLEAALKGFWAPALILPLYYLADATITLLRRLLGGQRIWQAHSQHFYQRAVQRGLSHATVVRIILLANGVLIVLALLAARGAETVALLGASVTVAALLTVLARWRGGAGDGAAGGGSDR
ncbi:MAG: glycosyl transferase, partial [Alphaproteobacteria bacterium]|nr:glycosyl transferase [Alphaproteobacteria bacterium]